MKANIVITALLLIFLIPLLIPLSLAQEFGDEFVLEDDFTLFSEGDFSVCRCGSHKSSFTVTNIGPFAAHYSVAVEGSAAPFVRFDANRFSLNPGESRKIASFYAFPCALESKEYRLKVYVTADSEVEKYFYQNADVNACPNAGIESYTPARSSTPCASTSFEFALENTGQVIETYEMGIDKFQDHTTFSENPITLRPGQKKDFLMHVAPECNVYGTQDFNLVIHSINSEAFAEEPLSLFISSQDIPAIAEGIDTIEIEYGENAVNIPIKNLGERDTVYEGSLEENERWMRLASDTLEINGESEGMLQLFTTPANDTADGEYSLKLVLKVKQTGVEYEKEFKVLLEKPSPVIEWFKRNFWKIVGSLGVVLALIAISALLLAYLNKTKEKRALKKIERQKKNEKKRQEKEEKRKAALRIKAEKQKEAEAVKKKKELENGERKERKLTQKLEKLKEKIFSYFMKEISKSHKLVPKSGKKDSLRLKLWLILVALALGAVIYLWRDPIYRYLRAVWRIYQIYVLGAVIALMVVAIAAIILRSAIRKRRMEMLSNDEISELYSKAKDKLREDFMLIRKEDMAKFYPRKLKRKIIVAAAILGCASGSVVWYYMNLPYTFITSGILAGCAALMLIVSLLSGLARRKVIQEYEYGCLSPSKEYDIKLGEKGFGELVFGVKYSCEGALMRVRKYKSCPVFVPAPEVAYQYLEIETINVENPKSVKVRFKIGKKWMQRNKVLQEDVALYSYSGGAWKKARTTLTDSQDKELYYEAELASLDTLAIAGKPSKPAEIPKIRLEKSREKKVQITRKRKIKLWPWAGLLLVLAAIVVAVYSTKGKVIRIADSLWDSVYNFFAAYWDILLVSLILLSAIIIFLEIRKRKKK